MSPCDLPIYSPQAVFVAFHECVSRFLQQCLSFVVPYILGEFVNWSLILSAKLFCVVSFCVASPMTLFLSPLFSNMYSSTKVLVASLFAVAPVCVISLNDPVWLNALLLMGFSPNWSLTIPARLFLSPVVYLRLEPFGSLFCRLPIGSFCVACRILSW